MKRGVGGVSLFHEEVEGEGGGGGEVFWGAVLEQDNRAPWQQLEKIPSTAATTRANVRGEWSLYTVNKNGPVY